MNYIEPHGHMVSRTTDDYQKMALAGCVAISEPAFWAGYDRASVQGFHDYFSQLTEYEPARAQKFGIEHYCWLCINPKEGDDPGFAREVIGIIPEFLPVCCFILGYLMVSNRIVYPHVASQMFSDGMHFDRFASLVFGCTLVVFFKEPMLCIVFFTYGLWPAIRLLLKPFRGSRDEPKSEIEQE